MQYILFCWSVPIFFCSFSFPLSPSFFSRYPLLFISFPSAGKVVVLIIQKTCKWDIYQLWRAGMAQRWERSLPTNVTRVRIPNPASYVGWVCCWFSSHCCDWEGFSPGSPVFLPPQTNNSIWDPRATGLSVPRLLSVTLVKQSRFIGVLAYFTTNFAPIIEHIFQFD